MWGKPINTYQFEVVGEHTPNKKEGWSRPKAKMGFDESKACWGSPLVIWLKTMKFPSCGVVGQGSKLQITLGLTESLFCHSWPIFVCTNGYVSKIQLQCELSWVSWNIPLTTAEHGLWLNLSKCSATLQFCLAEGTSWQPLPHSHNTVSLLVVNTNRQTEPFNQLAPWCSH